MTVLRSPDPGRKPRATKAKAKAKVVEPTEPRELEIPTEGKVPRERREPRPRFPHLIRPRPVRAAPTAAPVEGG